MVPKWWKLVIAFSSAMSMMISFGISGSTGIYNIEFMNHFNASTTDVSIVGSLNMAASLGSGPVVGILLRRMSYRQVALIGSLMGAGSLFCLPFLNKLVYLYILYGAVQGFGMAMATIPANIIIGLCFDKHRSLVTGMAMGGIGLGGVIFPLLINSLIHEYGWQGSFFILSGLSLQCVVLSVLLIPLHKIKGGLNVLSNETEVYVDVIHENKNENAAEISEVSRMKLQNWNQRSKDADNISAVPENKNDNASEIPEISRIKIQNRNQASNEVNNTVDHSSDTRDAHVMTVSAEVKVPIEGRINHSYVNSVVNFVAKDSENQVSNVYINAVADGIDHLEIIAVAKESQTTNDPESICDKSSYTYSMVKKMKYSSIIDVLRNNLYFLGDFSFIIFNVNNILWNISVVACWIISPEYFFSIGLTDADAATILTFGGIGIIVGCVIGGVLGNIKCCSRLYVYVMWHFLMAASLSCMTITNFLNFTVLNVLMFLNGVCFGGILSLLITLTVDILGHELLRDAFGYLMLSNGVGALAGPPLAGMIKDAVGDFKPAFYVSSVLLLIGGVLMFLIRVKKFCLDQTTEQNTRVASTKEKDTS